MSIKAMKWAYGLFEVIDLPPQERSILLALCWYHKDRSNECTPSQEVLSQMTGYRRQRVSEGLGKLEMSGLIKRSKGRKIGQFHSCSYRLFGSFSVRSVSGRGDTAKGSTVSKKRDTVTVSGWGDTIRGNNNRDTDVIDFPSHVLRKSGGAQ